MLNDSILHSTVIVSVAASDLGRINRLFTELGSTKTDKFNVVLMYQTIDFRQAAV